MLTKEECNKAQGILCIFVNHEEYFDADELSMCLSIFAELIYEHFELQLTSSECDLIILGLKSLEEELGMDVMLLIDKLRKIQSTLPRGEGVVECVEID